MRPSNLTFLIHAGQDWVLAMSMQAFASVIMQPCLGVQTALLDQVIAVASDCCPPSCTLFNEPQHT